ncbi:DUF2637 domain-containing protein (plasmid) [Streptomyces sp. BI20]|uniref:DUF2637 domain-containing protein n=1 Tax=Streptomyces sp. BI20 TaxID=3403460 RepID=UPI003C731D0A
MVIAVIVLAAAALAAVGLYLSFNNVASFAHRRLHFATLHDGRLFAIGVDVGIIVMIGIDLVMAWLRRPIGWVRFPVWALTGVTVVLNGGSVLPEKGRAWELIDVLAVLAHGTVPILFIIVVEIGRYAIDRILRPRTKTRTRDRIPVIRWVLAPGATSDIYKRMRLWGISSYPEMVRRDQERLGYEQWLSRKYKGDLSQATADEKLPMEMAQYGYTVAEALDLPRAQERDAKLREEQAKRDKAAAEQATELAAIADERERILAKGDRDRTRILAEGGTATAQAEMDGQVQIARRVVEIETEARERAETAESLARKATADREVAEQRQRQAAADDRAAELERAAAQKRKEAADLDRVAAAETAAVETQTIAKARQASAEHDKAAAEIANAAAETRRRASEVARRAAEEDERTQQAITRTEQLKADEAEARKRASEARLGASEVEARALEIEDANRLRPRERMIRRVARLILAAGGDAENVPLSEIQTEFAVSPPTASDYRREAQDLINSGYTPTTT